MKNKNLILCVYLLSALFYGAHAKDLLTCSHPEICELAKRIIDQDRVELVSEITIFGDPHDFTPKAESIKKLMDAKWLISGPHELNPWMKKINYQRSKNKSYETIILSLTPSMKARYKNASSEALAHFWLYPDIYCELLKDLSQSLDPKWHKKEMYTFDQCQKSALEINSRLGHILKNLKVPLILTHDALHPYILSLNPNLDKVVALKGSGHHEEATPETIKKLYQLLKEPKLIWLIESGIHVPETILRKKRNSDLVINLDTAKSLNNSNDQMVSQTLVIFSKKLEELNK